MEGCYSFATVAAIKANYFIKKKRKIEISEQNLIKFGPSSEFLSLHGCNGGTNVKTASFFIIKKVFKKKDYPFISYQGYCKTDVNYNKILVGVILQKKNKAFFRKCCNSLSCHVY